MKIWKKICTSQLSRLKTINRLKISKLTCRKSILSCLVVLYLNRLNWNFRFRPKLKIAVSVVHNEFLILESIKNNIFVKISINIVSNFGKPRKCTNLFFHKSTECSTEIDTPLDFFRKTFTAHGKIIFFCDHITHIFSWYTGKANFAKIPFLTSIMSSH